MPSTRQWWEWLGTVNHYDGGRRAREREEPGYGARIRRARENPPPEGVTIVPMDDMLGVIDAIEDATGETARPKCPGFVGMNGKVLRPRR